ncbi:alpha/beta fold hydrolase [Demequina sp. NBRC 110056]|uniref:alpha/beta fold hydrolase n=1 Tax=Demequina sp. NBRC 110056 TaxID=1570345 RepID=UPI0009FFE69C|nr:alpha/beta fold hydrolase [Demequina sp. NBRC 110056]
MHAVEPTRSGTVDRDGATIAYDVYERDAPTIVLLPTWELVDSRSWKMQIPYLSRHFRVVVFDAAGAGRSTGPAHSERYSQSTRLADAAAVLEATCPARAVVAGVSMGGTLAYSLAAYRPDLVAGACIIGADHPFRVDPPCWADGTVPFDPVTNPRPQGWSKVNPEYLRRDQEDFLRFFAEQICTDAHSTKGVDDVLEWGMSQDADIGANAIDQQADIDVDDWHARLAESRVPMLIVHGTEDRIADVAGAHQAAQFIPSARLMVMDGVGHAPQGRYPVQINHALRAFARKVFAPTEPSRERLDATAYAAPASARRRALYLSSPIGLGHARRDVAIAEELQQAHPDLEIEWLAQSPVTTVLAAAGHTIHPASSLLASESAHIEAECGEHALDALQALREMDEILCHNFHVLDEVTAETPYDAVIADESWELDYHLFENPALKRAPLAWMTDFVGQLPMAGGGERQAEVAADLNLEMIEHVANHPDLRDAAVFVGSPDDIVPGTLGPGLPGIREWTESHFDFSGYITGFDPRSLGDGDKLRASVGFGPREKVCVVAVGGTGVGRDLLLRVVSAVPAARRSIPELRVVVVTGPRIDPATMPEVEGVDYHAYVDRLYRWLAACDVAIVQGGLTTTMELTAAKVPFIYVPLRDHFEQNHHVRARLERYRAGRCMEYDDLSPTAVADALVDLLGAPVDYLDVSPDGAARAAALIGQLL